MEQRYSLKDFYNRSNGRNMAEAMGMTNEQFYEISDEINAIMSYNNNVDDLVDVMVKMYPEKYKNMTAQEAAQVMFFIGIDIGVLRSRARAIEQGIRGIKHHTETEVYKARAYFIRKGLAVPKRLEEGFQRMIQWKKQEGIDVEYSNKNRMKNKSFDIPGTNEVPHH